MFRKDTGWNPVSNKRPRTEKSRAIMQNFYPMVRLGLVPPAL